MAKKKKASGSTQTQSTAPTVHRKETTHEHYLRSPGFLQFMLALVVFGNGVSNKSGKEGGTVYSHNTYGSYTRNWTKPTDPKTAKQMTVRANFGNQSQAWRALSVLNQTSWNSLASTVSFTNRVGAQIFLKGQALFNKLNQNLISAGQSAITAAPAYTIPATPTAVSLAALSAGNTFIVTFTPTPVPAGVVFQVWATPALSAGRAYSDNMFKLLANVAAAATSPQTLTSAWATLFGTKVAGQIIYVRLRAVSTTTGVASPWMQAVATVG